MMAATMTMGMEMLSQSGGRQIPLAWCLRSLSQGGAPTSLFIRVFGQLWRDFYLCDLLLADRILTRRGKMAPSRGMKSLPGGREMILVGGRYVGA